MHNGQLHIIESAFLIDIILNHTPVREQEAILKMIVQIVFKNGDIHHYLEHLANGYVKMNF